MALDPLLSPPNGKPPFLLSFQPDFELVQVNSNGLVVRCSRSFEWGATLQLGVLLHIQLPSTHLAELSDDSADAVGGEGVLDVRGIVVDCHEVLSYPAAKPQYEITLFYDSVTEDQCSALLQASGQRTDLESPPSQGLRHFEPLKGFDRICGLN